MVMVWGARNHEQGLVELNGRAIFDQNRRNRATPRRGNVVHHLHRFDEDDGIAFFHAIAHRFEIGRAGFGLEIGGANHRGFDSIGICRGRCSISGCRSGNRGRGSNGCRGGGIGHRCGRQLARNADFAVAIFNLNLGQVGVGNQLRQFAHQRAVNLHATVLFIISHDFVPESLSQRNNAAGRFNFTIFYPL